MIKTVAEVPPSYSRMESSEVQIESKRRYSVSELRAIGQELSKSQRCSGGQKTGLKLQATGGKLEGPRDRNYSVAELRRIGREVQAEEDSRKGSVSAFKFHHVVDKDSLCALTYNYLGSAQARRNSSDNIQQFDNRQTRRKSVEYLIYPFDEFRKLGKGVWSKRRPQVVHPLIDNGHDVFRGRPNHISLAAPASEGDSGQVETDQAASAVCGRNLSDAFRSGRRSSEIPSHNEYWQHVGAQGSSSAYLSSANPPHGHSFRHLPVSVNDSVDQPSKPHVAAESSASLSTGVHADSLAQPVAHAGASKLLQAALGVGGLRTSSKFRSQQAESGTLTAGLSVGGQDPGQFAPSCLSVSGGSLSNQKDSLLGPLPVPSSSLLSKAPPLLPSPHGSTGSEYSCKSNWSPVSQPSGAAVSKSTLARTVAQSSKASVARPHSDSSLVSRSTTHSSCNRNATLGSGPAGHDDSQYALNGTRRGDARHSNGVGRGSAAGASTEADDNRHYRSNHRHPLDDRPCDQRGHENDLWDTPDVIGEQSAGIFSLGDVRTCEEAVSLGRDLQSYVKEATTKRVVAGIVPKGDENAKQKSGTGEKEDGEISEAEAAERPAAQKRPAPCAGDYQFAFSKALEDHYGKLFLDEEENEEAYAGSRFLQTIIGQGEGGRCQRSNRGMTPTLTSSPRGVPAHAPVVVTAPSSRGYNAVLQRNVGAAEDGRPAGRYLSMASQERNLTTFNELSDDQSAASQSRASDAETLERVPKQAPVKLGEEDGRRAGRILLEMLNASGSTPPPLPQHPPPPEGNRVSRNASTTDNILTVLEQQQQQQQGGTISSYMSVSSVPLPSPPPYPPPPSEYFTSSFPQSNPSPTLTGASPSSRRMENVDPSQGNFFHAPNVHFMESMELPSQGPPPPPPTGPRPMVHPSFSPQFDHSGSQHDLAVSQSSPMSQHSVGARPPPPPPRSSSAGIHHTAPFTAADTQMRYIPPDSPGSNARTGSGPAPVYFPQMPGSLYADQCPRPPPPPPQLFGAIPSPPPGPPPHTLAGPYVPSHPQTGGAAVNDSGSLEGSWGFPARHIATLPGVAGEAPTFAHGQQAVGCQNREIPTAIRDPET